MWGWPGESCPPSAAARSRAREAEVAATFAHEREARVAQLHEQGLVSVLRQIHDDLDAAVAGAAASKYRNSGQTCIAPDYLLAPAGQVDALVEALRERVAASYPTLRDNDDYTCIINERHYQRIRGLIEDAEARGARKVLGAVPGLKRPGANGGDLFEPEEPED